MFISLITVLIAIMVMIAAPVMAADWPSTMDVGGFEVTSIVGTSNPDGSGRAVGKVTIPGDGSCQIDLTRSASGSVTGSTRSSFSIAGVRIDGSFILDRAGLQGTGVVYTSGKQVTDANITVNARSGLSGNGRVNLGSGFSIGVTCDGGAGGFNVRGSSSRTATQDEAMAVYTFRGDIELSNSGPALVATAKGTIERKGKVGGVVSPPVSVSCPVDIASGKADFNANGTSISFNLW